MRTSLLVLVLVLAALALLWSAARADEVDPTIATPVPADPNPKPTDLCDTNPRCRIARFRAELAHQRRLEYLARLDAAAQEMDRRIQKSKPFRTRYPYELDFVYLSNVNSFGALIAYAPAFWVKLEGYAAGFTYSNYSNGGDFHFSGFSGGLDVRFLPLKFLLSPYVATGWGYLSGNSSYYNYDQDANSSGSSYAHLLTLGLGVEMTVPYFHFALGYQFQEAFYTQGIVQEMHDPALRSGTQSGMDAARHGAALEIGCAF
jgi:hypothetical protein